MSSNKNVFQLPLKKQRYIPIRPKPDVEQSKNTESGIGQVSLDNAERYKDETNAETPKTDKVAPIVSGDKDKGAAYLPPGTRSTSNKAPLDRDKDEKMTTSESCDNDTTSNTDISSDDNWVIDEGPSDENEAKAAETSVNDTSDTDLEKPSTSGGASLGSNKPKPTEVKCENCKNAFNDEIALRSHRRELRCAPGTDPIPIPIPDVGIRNRKKKAKTDTASNQKTSDKKEPKPRKFQCKWCSAAYVVQSHLTRHRTNKVCNKLDGECDRNCGEIFKQSDHEGRRMHMLTCNFERKPLTVQEVLERKTNDVTFQCVDCSAKYANKRQLTCHREESTCKPLFNECKNNCGTIFKMYDILSRWNHLSECRHRPTPVRTDLPSTSSSSSNE